MDHRRDDRTRRLAQSLADVLPDATDSWPRDVEVTRTDSVVWLSLRL